MEEPEADERVLHVQHVLATKKAHELGQIEARAALRMRGAAIVYQHTVDAATAHCDSQVHTLRAQMLEDLTAELKMLKENRDGVSLQRKGLSRAARGSRHAADDTIEPLKTPSTELQAMLTASRLAPSSRHKAQGLQRYTSAQAFKTAPAPAFLNDDLAEIAIAVVSKRQRLA
ncbi:hypothetical protein ACHHYP_17149 [Achlya hypogyna]|uniref:Uncharacterized protein n=1 Tax=Achlya hypogyna TaxID=1202772 RepID=A0A1V9Y506_ACHHY|nr:hypothetical protein ACHHYP_17149 [Achlya hypogyna]